MQKPIKSFLITVVLCMLLGMLATGARAASIYLDPDTVYITTGVGTEFDLELKVDAATTGVKLFKVSYDYDPTVLDTVTITEGPLFPSSGSSTFFGYYLIQEDTILQVEDLIFGAGVTVDGPGTLAYLRLKAIDEGMVNMSVISYALNDVNNDPIPSTASGAVIYVNYPPKPFNLMYPSDGNTVHRYPRDSVRLIWSPSTSVYPGENVTYELQYGTSSTFDAGSTTTVSGLTDTSYTLDSDDLSTQTYYWRVTATGDIYGFERESSPDHRSFDFVLDNPLTAFSLIYPGDGQTASGIPGEQVTFSWHESNSVYAGEWVEYKFELSTTSNFSPGTVTTRTVSDTTNSEPADNFDEITYYWRVTAIGGLYSYERQSDPYPGSFTFQQGVIEPAVFDLVLPEDSAVVELRFDGPASFEWGFAGSGVPDDTLMYHFFVATDHNFPGSALRTDSVQDLTQIVVDTTGIPTASWLYWKVRATNRYDLTRWSTSDRAVMFYWRGDMDGDHKYTLNDITSLIGFVYLSGLEPTPRAAGDIDCDGKFTLNDITQLIGFIYLGGSGFECQ
ncbi:MAG: cohesin domain-containing protein [Candidatus Zixiibacteriota bacterium]|jgi:hypothetical protein